ncbi:MAG: glycosyltransferase family 2 protein [Chloroflexota bacterium]|nr:glycosyltransferase family 2 protein [Chloroflexota bacterium]
MAKQVAVVIVNWNGRHHLEDCLTALFAQTFTDFEAILVDNGSTDGSVKWVEAHFPQVRLIRNTWNVGFATGNNQAIHSTDAEFVVTLNNDTRAEPRWLAALVEPIASDPTVGMVASKMLFADRPDTINSAGIALDPVGIAWDRLGGTPDDPGERTPVEVFGPCAGAALYRRVMLDRIGLFDDDFFAYMEDVDLAWRARLAGWRCLYAPAARVYHAHSATSVEGSPFKSRLLGRNKVWLIAKNYGPTRRLLAYLPLIVLYDLAAVTFALVARGDVHSLLGRIDGISGLPSAWRKRRAVQILTQGNRDSPWHHHLEPPVWPWQVPRRYQHIATIAQTIIPGVEV